MLDFRPQRARSAISRWAREWTRFHRRRNSKHWSANCTYASPIHTGRATCAVARCSTHARALARSPIPHRCIFTRSPARRPHKSPPNPPLSHRAADAQSAARRARAFAGVNTSTPHQRAVAWGGNEEWARPRTQRAPSRNPFVRPPARRTLHSPPTSLRAAPPAAACAPRDEVATRCAFARVQIGAPICGGGSGARTPSPSYAP